MNYRKIKFVKDVSPRAKNDNKNLLRDVGTTELIMCAFDKHGRCRRDCAALTIEEIDKEILCQRMDGRIIGCLEEEEN